MDFDAYLQSKGYAPGSKVPKTTANQLHAAWLKESGGGFQPQIVEVPVPGGGTEQAFMSSPNSAQMIRDPQSRVRYEVGNDGNLYMVDGTTAAVVTNAVGGAPLQPNPKSSAFADMMGLMGQQAPAQPQPGPISRFLGMGGQPTPAPTPEPTPMPSPSPMPMATPEQRPAGPAGPTMGTNAPTPVAAPTVFSVQQYQQMTGEQLPPGDYADANGRPFSIR
jgi:hypothetical protein